MSTFITFAVLLFAAVRVTRLIVVDKLSEPLRQFLLKKLGAENWVTYLFFCPWCIGFWVSLAAAWLTYEHGGLKVYMPFPEWLSVPLVALAMSYVVGWVLSREDVE